MMQITCEVGARLKNLAFVCSFLVVVIHCIGVYSQQDVFAWCCLRDGICRMAVPTFSLLSGFFLAGKTSERGWWKREVGKRCVSLLIPFVIWNALLLCFHLLRTRLCGGVTVTAMSVLAAFGLNPFEHPSNAPLWYVRALFLIVAISPAVIFFVSRGRKRAIFTLLSLFALYGVLGPWEGEYGMTEYFFRKTFALQCLFYFTCGAAWRLGSINLNLKRPVAIGVMLVAVLLLVLKVYLQVKGIPVYRYAGWLAMPFAVVACLNLITSQSFSDSIVSLSFPIYVFHQFVIHMHLFALNRYWGGGGMQSCKWPMTAVLTLETFVTSILLVLFIRKTLPERVNKVLWGGR